MKKTPRILALFLCVVILSSLLTACNKQSSGKTQVEVWHNWNVEEGGTEYILKELVNEYNASQNEVEVLLISQPSEGFSDKVYASVSTGTGPDIYFNFATSVPQYIEGEFLADMGKYMDTDVLRQRIPDSMWQECTSADGKLHIVPIQTSVCVLFYNKTLYDKLGLDAPATWADIEEDAKIIYEQEGIPGFAVDSYIDLAQILFGQTGATYIDTETKTVGFNTPACAEQLEWYANGIEAGYFTSNFESGSIDQDFNAGLLGCFLGTCTYEPYILPDGFDYAVAPSPLGSVQDWTPIFSRGAIVFSSDEATEAAACDFLEFFTNAQNSARWAMNIGSLSPYSDSAQLSDYTAYIADSIVLTEAVRSMEYAYSTPAVVGAPVVRNEIKQMFLQVIGGLKTASEALAEAEANCNAALQN